MVHINAGKCKGPYHYLHLRPTPILLSMAKIAIKLVTNA
jgi:hypothetical protein